ncbi:hypothetical protein FTUN_2367 [Frigoriglobus tundricola]|uniref:Uncharacterized protein n=1 Tax=Frigoriglobus tundricola TaxID=2774151 RepID=A0A6M5YNL6_9BACT|nr:hypothetical protein FTUN_2367 [Frigoriglobus tundricola]
MPRGLSPAKPGFTAAPNAAYLNREPVQNQVRTEETAGW